MHSSERIVCAFALGTSTRRRLHGPSLGVTGSALWVMLSAASLGLVAGQAGAELIAYEGFEYDAGDLRNQNGGVGDWTSAWGRGSGFGSGASWQVGPPSLSYTDSGGRTLRTRGGAARADAGDVSKEFRETRSWNAAAYNNDGDELWFSFLFHRSGDNTSGVHFYIAGSGGLHNGLGVFLGTFSLSARINSSSAGYRSFSPDEDHFVVGRITFSDTEDDEVRYWLNPDLDRVPLDTASNSGVNHAAVSAASWNRLYMRHPNNPGRDMIDEIRLGTDFFSVAPLATVAGDFDLDGDVDAFDLGIWQTGFGITGGAAVTDGDADGDGDVDAFDLGLWQTNFGFGVEPDGPSVPEPAIGALFGGGLALGIRRRRTGPGR